MFYLTINLSAESDLMSANTNNETLKVILKLIFETISLEKAGSIFVKKEMNFNSKMIILKNKKLSWNNRMLEWL
jgi:hypothetical protein